MKRLLVLVIIMFSCQSTLSYGDATQEIAKKNELIHQAFLKKDLMLLDKVYADDAFLMAPGLAIIQSKKKILELWSSNMGDVIEMQSKTVEIIGKNDMFYEIGIVTTKIRNTQDSIMSFKSKYCNIWKRVATNELRLSVDMWNELGN